MHDLEQQLARLGYRSVDREPVCWQVAQIGDAKPKHKVHQKPGPRPIGRACNLYMWILRTTDTAAEMYRVTRIAD